VSVYIQTEPPIG